MGSRPRAPLCPISDTCIPDLLGCVRTQALVLRCAVLVRSSHISAALPSRWLRQPQMPPFRELRSECPAAPPASCPRSQTRQTATPFFVSSTKWPEFQQACLPTPRLARWPLHPGPCTNQAHASQPPQAHTSRSRARSRLAEAVARTFSPLSSRLERLEPIENLSRAFREAYREPKEPHREQ